MKSDITSKAVKYCIESIKEFYEEDNILWKVDAGERCMVFRIGLYLDKLITHDSDFENYSVDCEYNRQGYNVKTLESKDHRDIIIPDILIHKRNFPDNIVAIEFKKTGNSISGDKKKLLNLTDQNKEYKYKAGLLVVLGKKSFRVITYEAGKIKSDERYTVVC